MKKHLIAIGKGLDEIARGVIIGAILIGAIAFAWNQVGTAFVNHGTQTPTYRETSDGDVGCVLFRGQLSCFERTTLEPMPEPEAELTIEEATELLRKSMMTAKVS